MDHSDEIRSEVRKAESVFAAGDRTQAVEILQRAAARLSAAAPSVELDRLHGDICRRLADLLLAEGRPAEAMQALQEAVDSYARVPGAESDGKECARRIVAGVRGMWRSPDRLLLLIARLDRECRQL